MVNFDDIPKQAFADFEAANITLLANTDSYIVNALVKCGVNWPTIFGLMWGDKMIDSEEFPLELRTIVVNLFHREEGKEECLDPIERKLYDIIIDCTYVLYEKQINSLVKTLKENAGI
jgi:hypothetical protein